ncbi:DUF5415 family protein [Enterococcus raffinosus]|uniref:DUF5415 family protein n=1 Tax=Enterococcus raffinosus TaxID=71452 RepID=UPI00288F18A6|nr:DUF5415 family protein [Enterococcus raffinosus]MDT2525129.1 DUF5415 family protein [Enterococcus raffinosus]MDT2592484.1 DUF5415 family protein [Enterococcus raffinosus]
MARTKKLSKKEEVTKLYLESKGISFDQWKREILEKAIYDFLNSNSSVRKEFESSILNVEMEKVLEQALAEFVSEKKDQDSGNDNSKVNENHNNSSESGE